MEWIFYNSPAISVLIIYGLGYLGDLIQKPLVTRGFKTMAIYLTWPWIFWGASPVWWILFGRQLGPTIGIPIIFFNFRDIILFIILPLVAIYFTSILIREPKKKSDSDWSESLFYYQVYPVLQLFFWIFLVGRGLMKDL